MSALPPKADILRGGIHVVDPEPPQRAEIGHDDAAPAIYANPKWFDAETREEGIETISIILKDGKIDKNAPVGELGCYGWRGRLHNVR